MRLTQTALVGFGLLSYAAACSPGGGTEEPPSFGSDTQVLPAGCALDNQTQPCACDSRPGRQVCFAGAWSACECADVAFNGGPGSASGDPGAVGSSVPNFAGNQRTDITFEWLYGAGTASGSKS